jgi:hypothetical protein
MSTKTIYKRIALVAVTALGAGVLSVAPANATDRTIAYTYTASGTATDSTTAVAAGTAITLTPTATTSGAIATATIPLSSVFTLRDPNGADVTASAICTAGADVADNITSISVAPGTCTFASTLAIKAGAVVGALGTIVFTPTMGGLYSLQAGHAESATTDKITALALTTVATGTTSSSIHVSGIRVSQGTTRGLTGIATVGNQAQVSVLLPAQTAAQNYRFVSSGVGAIVGATPANLTNTPIAGADNFSAGLTAVSAGNTTLTTQLLTLTNAVAGVQTITVTSINATTGVAAALYSTTVTWGAASVVSVSNSTAFISAGNDCATSDDVGGVTLSSAAGSTLAAGVTTGATICILIKDQNNSTLAGQALTATIAGPGLILMENGAGVGAANPNIRASSLTAAQMTTDAARIGIIADGTSGTGTITISSGTTVLATKTLTFFGAVTTLTAKQNHRLASTAGVPLGDGTGAPDGLTIGTTPAVVITATDANGIRVPNLTFTALSSDTAVMSNTIPAQAGVTAAPGTYNLSVRSVANTSGKTATLTFRVMSGTTVLAAAAPLTYTLGGAVATVALSLNKASYTPGEAAVATLTLKDSAGNAAFDGDHATILTGALVSSLSIVKALQFSTTATSVASLGGVSTVAFNAPASAASAWIVSGTTGAGPSVDKAKALTATAAVSSSSDIAALAAANAAITTLINSLIAKINALNKLVIKIQKKVRA